MKTDPNLKYISSKVECIMNEHVVHRKNERDGYPERFDVKKTLAEKCIQRPIPEVRTNSDTLFSDGSYN